MVLALLGAGAIGGRGIRADFGLDGLVPGDDAEFRAWRDLSAELGRDDNTAFVFVVGDDLLSPAGGSFALELSRALEDSPLVDEVVGLATATLVEERGGRLRVGPILDRQSLEQVDWAALRGRLTTDPVYAGRVLSRDGRTAGFAVRLRDDRAGDEHRAAVVAYVDGVLARFAAPGRAFLVTGNPHTRTGYLRLLRRDAALFTALSALLLALALLAAFRSLSGVLLPLLALFLALLLTGAVQALSGRPIGLLSAAIPVMVLIVGTSDAVHLLQRWGEELAAGQERLAALERALAATARACLFTSLITASGFFLLPATGIPMLGDLGLVVGAGVLLAYGCTLTLIPALGALLPPPRPPAPARGLPGLAGAVLRRPWLAVAAALVPLGLLGALGAPRLRVESRVVDDLPEDDPLVRTRAEVEARMGGNMPLSFLVRPRAAGPGAAEDPGLLAAVASFQATLRELRDPALARTLSAADVLGSTWRALEGEGPLPATPEGVAQVLLLLGEDPLRGCWDEDHAWLRVDARLTDAGTTATFALLDRARAAFAATLGERATLEVQGFTYLAQRVHRDVVQGCLTGFGLDFALVAALVGLLFRSLRLSLLALVPNLVPLVGALGFMGLVGIELRISSGLVFCIVFGIAVDDTVHFLARYHEERRAGLGPRAAAARTIETAGRAMACMSAVLAAGFAVLLLSSFSPNRVLGLLLPVTVLLGLLGDLVLLPALLVLCDREGPA